MIKEAINRILELKETEILRVGEHTYSTKSLQLVTPPRAEVIRLSSLQSLVDLLVNQKEGSKREVEIVQVESPTEVTVKSTLLNEKNRDLYYVCEAQLPQISFEQFLDIESFNIMCQSYFSETEDLKSVLAVVGNVRSENVQTVGDDGVSQQVEVRAGIARASTQTVPNPVILQPFRTFMEVDQPSSRFIFRMKDGPTAALFEADGGKWKLEAMQNIKKYLEGQLTRKFLVIA